MYIHDCIWVHKTQVWRVQHGDGVCTVLDLDILMTFAF